MKIAVVGTGYVGLVSGVCFAEFGFSVTCIDKDAGKIEALNKGIVPIYEPGLDALIATHAANGRLCFTTHLEAAVGNADVVFIAVGTPTRRGDGFADLTYVYEAAKDIARSLKGYTVVATKSTVPVGTGKEVATLIQATNPSADVDVVSNPEFLREGSAINDFMRPDRVVVGSGSERAQQVMAALYRPLYLLETPMVYTSIETAELIKYASNAFLATKISFINEMADLCEKCGADVQDVAKGMGLDNRIGKKFLHPGPGYGGSCFPKDTLALVKTAQHYKTSTSIVEAVVNSNNKRKEAMIERIMTIYKGDVRNKTIAFLGVTFKPNTDDMRDSPALTIIPGLQEAGANIVVFDPQGLKEGKALLPNVTWATSAYNALTGANGVVILTEWNEFRALDPVEIKKHLKDPYVIDLRNIYDPHSMCEAGLHYYSVGRPTLPPALVM